MRERQPPSELTLVGGLTRSGVNGNVADSGCVWAATLQPPAAGPSLDHLRETQPFNGYQRLRFPIFSTSHIDPHRAYPLVLKALPTERHACYQ